MDLDISIIAAETITSEPATDPVAFAAAALQCFALQVEALYDAASNDAGYGRTALVESLFRLHKRLELASHIVTSAAPKGGA